MVGRKKVGVVLEIGERTGDFPTWLIERSPILCPTSPYPSTQAIEGVAIEGVAKRKPIIH